MLIASIVDWDWVALGTLALAAATFALAWQNRAIVKAAKRQIESAQKELDLTREQNDSIREQGVTAQAALDAQTAPYLTSVPFGIYDAAGPVPGPDASWIEAFIGSGQNEQRASIGVPFRNIGNGLATIKHVIFLFAGGNAAVGVTTNPVLSPGEWARARFDITQTSSLWDELVGTLSGYGNFSVVLEYGDAAYNTRGALRLDVYAREGDRGWYVRQVHYGDTWEQAQQEPKSSSQPLA